MSTPDAEHNAASATRFRSCGIDAITSAAMSGGRCRGLRSRGPRVASRLHIVYVRLDGRLHRIRDARVRLDEGGDRSVEQANHVVRDKHLAITASSRAD